MARGNGTQSSATRSPLAPVAPLAGSVVSTEATPPGRSGGLARRTKRLRASPLPVVSPEDWADAEVPLATLYRRAERRAIDTVDAHRRRGNVLRLEARLLRAIAAGLTACGLLLPLVAVVRSNLAGSQWCVLFFAGAVLVLAVERLCGLAVGSRRELADARIARHRLEVFQDDWTAACVPGAIDGEVEDRLAILRTFGADLRALDDLRADVEPPARAGEERETAS